tara:strand:+ start:1399 stop:1563 length:165 start_codon:yes stop_codon:yes gene_type:complete
MFSNPTTTPLQSQSISETSNNKRKYKKKKAKARKKRNNKTFPPTLPNHEDTAGE